MIASVTAPEYFLTTKGRMKNMEMDLLSTSQPSQKEGEGTVRTVDIKCMQLYGIPDLDGVPKSCSVKAAGVKRMLKVGGLVRLMGERFERLVEDLFYCRETFTATCQRYAETSENLPKSSPFKSFIKLPKLTGLPVQDNEETLELLLLGNNPMFDRSQISLKDFISFKVDNISWGRSPTRYGRVALLDAFTNLQKVLVVYFGNDFSTCCEDVIEMKMKTCC